MNAVIGLDYGTQGARSVLLDTATGQVLLSHSVSYPHGVIEGGLASAEDYEMALFELIRHVTPEKYRNAVAGICVDATSLTLVPVAATGQPLSLIPEFSHLPHAQIKLWKYHKAEKQAQEALSLAQNLGEPFLKRTGGAISSEWMLPKLLEIRDEAPELYQKIDTALDLCEFLTFRLTGKLARSMGAMCFKGLWAQDLGFPSSRFLNELRPNLSEEYRYKMRGPVLRPGDRAGFLRPELCREFGLPSDVAVAAGALDGHTAPAALGALQAGDAALVIGTSNVLTVQTEQLCEAEGICGIALDGLTPGLYGIDSGQSSTGDMLDWFVQTMLPEHASPKAQPQKNLLHQQLTARVQNPWENAVIAADWWNGSRNAPCDLSLRGNLYGLSLNTKPEDIYLALLQGIACGTREIIETCAAQGVSVKRLFATGGIAGKNTLLMEQYANLLGLPVQVGQAKEGPALGAAIFAAVAAGIYSTPWEAYQHMGIQNFTRYSPDENHRSAYEALYQKNHLLRDFLSRISQV